LSCGYRCRTLSNHSGGASYFASIGESEGEAGTGQFPAQFVSNIASWASTTLVGRAASACGEATSGLLVARIDTDTARMFGNGFA